MSAVDRFRLVRAGIINLYEYGDQVFELSAGRLLLRGHNTSGKTKALELLLPFALDGDISPRKLDPFAKASKEMRWNLVGCIDRDQRTGYVWLEFERLTTEGTERVTAIIGMKANANVPGVTRWYAVVRGRRIGEDLSLRRGDTVLTKSELVAELGDEAPLISTATEYRRVLNREVFGFASEDSYQTMLTLMLELRRPHLSKALDPAGVTRLLGAALPEVDHDLIRRLGDGLEQLEDMRRALERLRRAHRRLERFLSDAYGAYARAVLRERGDALRSAETGYENAARRHREALTAAEEARSDTERIGGELAVAHEATERAEGVLTALLQSPEWQSVEAVEQLARRAERQRRAADTAREHAEIAESNAVHGETQVALSAADLAEAEDEATGARERLSQAASASGFGGRHAVLDEQLADGELDAWRGLAADQVTAWRAVLAEQERRFAAIDRAERELEQAQAMDEAAELRLRGARRRLSDATSAHEELREQLAEAIERWASGLRELAVSDLAGVMDSAGDAGQPGAVDPRTHWQASAEERLRELAAARAEADARRTASVADLSTLHAELAELDATVERGPDPPVTRPADRGRRAGMPLWQAVEFAPGLDPAAQAGLEAALEGAGVLDAWVTPDGSVLGPETLDAVLVAGSDRPSGPTLANALHLAGDAPEPLGATLASVTLASDATQVDGLAAVDLRGGYALGPLRGRYAKPEAEHMGASARAAARARRRATLRRQIAAAEQQLAEIDEAVRELIARSDRLAAEQTAFPSLDPLGAAARTRLVADKHADELAEERSEAQGAVVRACADRDRARDDSRAHAETAGLPGLLTPTELQIRVQAAARYEDGLAHAVASVRRLRGHAQRTAEHRERLAELQAHAARLDRTAAAEATDARRLVAEHAEREAALSSDAGALRERRQTVEGELRAARDRLAQLREADKAAAVGLATTTAEATTTEATERDARTHREAMLAGFARLERSDIFRLALEEDTPEDHRHAADWTLTRALDVLRAVPAARLVAEPVDKLSGVLSRACSELDRDLAQEADMSVAATVDGDGIFTVRVRDGAAERSLRELTTVLADETAERERTLTAEQRRVFSEALLEEIAAHLRGRIHEVRTRVDEMNGILGHSATAAGKVVQLGWRPGEEESIAAVIPLIEKPASGLDEREREALVAFFRSRIELARATEIDSADGEGAIRTLRDAFDYRRWFAFDLWEGTGRERQRLTARRHAVGSGGEQAVLVHLPLFAAAASLYAGAPTAPRLIMLDEALSGIDDDTRARVMGALVDLDLDFVMTSHELWGTYHTVPSLAIYQLYREQGIFGVSAERFVWDGALLREEEQGELFRA